MSFSHLQGNDTAFVRLNALVLLGSCLPDVAAATPSRLANRDPVCGRQGSSVQARGWPLRTTRPRGGFGPKPLASVARAPAGPASPHAMRSRLMPRQTLGADPALRRTPYSTSVSEEEKQGGSNLTWTWSGGTSRDRSAPMQPADRGSSPPHPGGPDDPRTKPHRQTLCPNDQGTDSLPFVKG